MKVGDLVLLRGNMWSSWKNQGMHGIVIDVPASSRGGGLLIAFDQGTIKDYSGYEAHFEVINESR